MKKNNFTIEYGNEGETQDVSRRQARRQRIRGMKDESRYVSDDTAYSSDTRAQNRGTEDYSGGAADYNGRAADYNGRAAEYEGSGSTGRGRRGRKRAGSGPVVLIIAVLCLLFGAAGMWAVNYLRQPKSEAEETTVSPEKERLEGIKQYLSSGKAVLETLRKFYPDDLVYYHDDKYGFVPFDPSLKQNDFSSDKVRKSSDGTWGYIDGDTKALKGIDVSSFQGDIDWEKVAASKVVNFAMIRAMYRGYESGKLVEDEKFRSNIEGAQANGIDTGVYVFTQAVNRQEVDEEVSMLNGLLGAYDINYPVVVDIEEIEYADARMDALTKEERTEIIKYYCEKLKESGYKPMLYYNIYGALNLFELSELEDVDKWFAVYDSDFYYPYAYQMWQYKDTGNIDGIEENVDLDLYFPDK